ncbi:MAG: type I restriction endonuclease [bacterium]|nr:type I restriction endonuclease [bacterium]
MSPTLKNLKEEAFEKHIFKVLGDMHGYRLRDAESSYDKKHVLDHELLFEFLRSTQQEKMERLEEMYGERLEERLIERVANELSSRGVIDVLRNGIEEGPVRLEMMHFKPTSGLNPEVQQLYKMNIWSVMRQVYFSEKTEQSVDLVLFVNGIPIATAELKNAITGQTVRHAMRQYRTDRDPRELLFTFRRCAAHFAVDTDAVYVTTKLAKQSTFFLPFNQGYKNGAGNPPSEDGHRTKYLWEDVWSPDSWHDLLKNFIHVFTEIKEGKDGREYPVEIQAFPRFHQRKTVSDIIDSVNRNGVGDNYLVQHSAGSGKSMTIAWTAFRLAELHNDANEKVFDTVIVMTDRRALDQQLRETVSAFEQTQGYLVAIDEKSSKSQQLKNALESGAKVITTTIQAFPVVAEIIEKLPGKKFGLIIDEAHSSQSGETSRTINEVLGGEYETEEDWILQQVENRKQPGNLSYFAFTATPKSQTIERFGTRMEDGSYRPFSLCSMKQAIEERFILDVLKNYVTYKRYFKMIEDLPDDPEVPRNRALTTIIRYVDLHEDAITQKIDIMMTHFDTTVSSRIDGNAKAMIVTRSREAAVRYKLAFDKYVKDHGISYRSLVAFTDSIKVDGETYTETGMNGGIPESHTAEEFKKPAYKFLIVAEKYQTGFDQPLLTAMYVDKTLSGVQAVQTLSRLNRTAPDKDEVFVLDFVNDAEDIKEAFDPYYTTTILSEGTDVNTLNDLRRDIQAVYPIPTDALDEFASVLGGASEGVHEKANAILDHYVEDITKLEPEKYELFKSKVYRYTKSYPFVASVLDFVDVSHEKLFLFLKYLLKKLPRDSRGGPLNILDLLDLEDIRVVRKMSGSIALDESETDLKEDEGDGELEKQEEETEVLSEIIRTVNKQWGAEFGEEQQKTLSKMAEALASDEEFKDVVKNSSRHGASLKFADSFKDKYDDQYENDQRLWEQLTNNPDLREYVREKMFDYALRKIEKQ